MHWKLKYQETRTKKGQALSFMMAEKVTKGGQLHIVNWDIKWKEKNTNDTLSWQNNLWWTDNNKEKKIYIYLRHKQRTLGESRRGHISAKIRRSRIDSGIVNASEV